MFKPPHGVEKRAPVNWAKRGFHSSYPAAQADPRNLGRGKAHIPNCILRGRMKRKNKELAKFCACDWERKKKTSHKKGAISGAAKLQCEGKKSLVSSHGHKLRRQKRKGKFSDFSKVSSHEGCTLSIFRKQASWIPRQTRESEKGETR